jgi:superfamily II DNA or RNA helicase
LKIIVKNVSSLLQTTNKELLSILRKKYSAKIPGARYSRAYRKGWDGTKYFISEKGSFGTGLLPFIISDLESADLEYELEDQRSLSKTDYDIDVKGIQYRSYQKSLIELALEKRMALIKAPTGAGKTIILAGILKALENKTGLIFFTQRSLLLQTYSFLKENGFDVGVAFGSGVDLKPITLCTVQSIHKVLDSHLDQSEFIIFDEVHEFSKGKIATKVVKSFPNAIYRFGMSATMPRDKMAKLNLVSYLGDVISEVDVKGLVEEGFLTPPVVNFIGMPEYKDHSLLDVSYMDIYDRYIINNEVRNEKIKALCESINTGRILILVKNLNHLQILRDMIPGSKTLEGKDDLSLRTERIQDFKRDSRSVLIGTKILQTGIDIPEITHLINARGLKSEIATLQALGRALRIHESKNKVYIYDFNDQVPYLKEHALARRRAYKSLKIEVNDKE